MAESGDKKSTASGPELSEAAANAVGRGHAVCLCRYFVIVRFIPSRFVSSRLASGLVNDTLKVTTSSLSIMNTWSYGPEGPAIFRNGIGRTLRQAATISSIGGGACGVVLEIAYQPCGMAWEMRTNQTSRQPSLCDLQGGVVMYHRDGLDSRRG